MASKFSFEVEGLQRLIKKVEKLGGDVELIASAEIEEFVKEVNAEQVAKAPIGTDPKNNIATDVAGLRTGNTFRGSGLNWEILNSQSYAPYVEFGTGTGVDVPSELRDYAIQFKGRGIRQVNLPARPFFFEPFMRRRKELVENIKKALIR